MRESGKKDNINSKQNKYIFRKYDKINNILQKDVKLENAYVITMEDYNKIKQNSDSKKKIEVKIYSTKDDIIKLINDKIQFVIVNEYFIQDFYKSTKFKNKKHIDIYTNETTTLLFFDKNQMLEIKYNKDNLIKNNTYYKNELIIKKLTLLYAFEKEFQKKNNKINRR